MTGSDDCPKASKGDVFPLLNLITKCSRAPAVQASITSIPSQSFSGLLNGDFEHFHRSRRQNRSSTLRATFAWLVPVDESMYFSMFLLHIFETAPLFSRSLFEFDMVALLSTCKVLYLVKNKMMLRPAKRTAPLKLFTKAAMPSIEIQVSALILQSIAVAVIISNDS
jgi:hypothetical protein